MEYKPFKMKGSPMKRNFGIGDSESPDKTSPNKIKIKGKGLGSILGESLQAGIDAGAGTSYQKDKEAKEEKEKAKEERKAEKELEHKRAIEKILTMGKDKLNKKEKLEGDLNGDGVVDDKDANFKGTGTGEGEGEGTGEGEGGE
jgi:hypothetical protein